MGCEPPAIGSGSSMPGVGRGALGKLRLAGDRPHGGVFRLDDARRKDPQPSGRLEQVVLIVHEQPIGENGDILMSELQKRLKGGFFVSSMMGVTDGAFCARVLGTRQQGAPPCAMVQTGAYLGEDDIIRYDDVYARGQGAKG